jgi:hypothetical protein
MWELGRLPWTRGADWITNRPLRMSRICGHDRADPPPALTLAFDGGYVRRMRKGERRNFEILTGACEKGGKIKVFATAFKGPKSLRRRLSRFIGRVGHVVDQPTALMSDGAESLLRLKKLLPIPTRFVLDYFHVAMKVRHADQCIGRIPPCRFSPDGSIFELYDRFNYLRGYLWGGRRVKFKESFDRLLWLLDRVRDELPDSERSAGMAIGHLCDLEAYLHTAQLDNANLRGRGLYIRCGCVRQIR